MNRLNRYMISLIFALTALFAFNQCEDSFVDTLEGDKYELIYYDEIGQVHSIILKDIDTPPPPFIDSDFPKKGMASSGVSDDTIHIDLGEVVIECDSFTAIEDPFFLSLGSGVGNMFNTHNVDGTFAYIRIGSIQENFLINDSLVQPFIEAVITVVETWFINSGNTFDSLTVFDKSRISIPDSFLIPDFSIMIEGSSVDKVEFPGMRIVFPNFTPLATVILVYEGNRAVHNTFIGLDTLAPLFSSHISLDIFSLWGGLDSSAAGDAIQVLIDTCKGDIWFGVLNGNPIDSVQYEYLDSVVQVLID